KQHAVSQIQWHAAEPPELGRSARVVLFSPAPALPDLSCLAPGRTGFLRWIRRDSGMLPPALQPLRDSELPLLDALLVPFPLASRRKGLAPTPKRDQFPQPV